MQEVLTKNRLRAILKEAVIIAIVVALLLTVAYLIGSTVTGLIQGDPFINRIEGAAGVCDVVGHASHIDTGSAIPIYKCTPAQAEVAANIVAIKYATQRTIGGIAGMLVLLLVLLLVLYGYATAKNN